MEPARTSGGEEASPGAPPGVPHGAPFGAPHGAPHGVPSPSGGGAAAGAGGGSLVGLGTSGALAAAGLFGVASGGGDRGCGSGTSLSPSPPPGGSDLVLGDFMQRLGSRLNLLESELKYAWRALDLLSHEYVRMWTRLEKLEALLYEQQNVIGQLLEFYSSVEAGDPATHRLPLDNARRALQAIADARVGGFDKQKAIEAGEAAAAAGTAVIDTLVDEIYGLPGEAFYRSLNTAFREDLIHTENTPLQSSQLGMIWEESEEPDETVTKKDEGRDISSLIKELVDVPEVYSALDYKDYRGNSPCVSEHDLAQLSQLSAIDQNALEKLQELDRLTNKLQRDSASLKELKSRLLESPRKTRATGTFSSQSVEPELDVEAQIESWALSSSPRDDSYLLSNVTPNTSSYKSRTGSHLDVLGATEAELTSSYASYSGTVSPASTSPRHRSLMESSTSAYGSSSKVSYGSSILHGDLAASCSSLGNKTASDHYSSVGALSGAVEAISSRLSDSTHSTKLGDGHSSSRLTEGISVTRLSDGLTTSRLSEGISSPRLGDSLTSSRYAEGLFSGSRERVCSPTPSAASVRTRKDGYIDNTRIDSDLSESLVGSFEASSSPPPPAPNDSDRLNRRSYEVSADDSAVLEMLIQEEQQKQEAERNTLSASLSQQPGRLSPHTPRSPKSPRLSPKHVPKSSSSNIIAAKSDSGLSSMSGWSSLEKSPGSPKNSMSGIGKAPLQAYDNAYLELETQQLQLDAALASTSMLSTSPRRSPLPTYPETKPGILPGGHHTSAFTTVGTAGALEDATRHTPFAMVPSTTPLADLTSSPKSRSTYSQSYFSSSASNSAGYSDLPYSMDQSALYSIAGGSRQPSYSSLYSSSNYISKSPMVEYPDLIRPVSRSQIHGSSSYSVFKPEPETARSTINSGFPTPTRSPLGSRERRERLARVNSTGSVPPSGLPTGAIGGVANMEAYKTAMYRTMFPTGNITDALSYYPTSSSRNERFFSTQPRPDGHWMSRSIDGTVEHLSYDPSMASISSTDTSTGTISYASSHTTSAARSDSRVPRLTATPSAPPPRAQIMSSTSTEYRQYRPASEMDLRYSNMPDEYEHRTYRQAEDERLYNQGGVIVSQSGYLSIASDMREPQQVEEKPPKKPRRTGSLKQAMSSVSQWLPDLKDLNVLPKRHRSNSLPSGVHQDETKVSKDYLRYFTLSRGKHGDQAGGSRKKKRHPLVSTMSGFIQRAKKRGPLLRHSLSDTETEPNEPEWSPPKAMRSQRSMGGVSDSEDGAYEHGFERVVFDRVPPRGSSFRAQKRDSFSSMETRRIDDSDMDADYQSQPREQRLSSDYRVENLGRNREDSADMSSLFATIGDVKKTSSNGGELESSTQQENIQIPPLTIPAANREWAASRALGKYRQRQSSNSVSEAMSEGSDEKTDEGPSPRASRHVDNDIVPRISEDDSALFEEKEKKIIEEPTIIVPQPSLGPLPVIESEPPPSFDSQMQATGLFQAPSPLPSVVSSPTPSPLPEVQEQKPEGSPSPSMHRGQTGNRHYLPRHQQSLEIPSLSRGGGSLEDDDNRSTHSWRSTSRVSSRRQSTEDSIDSEDEWYWYELRKLEEMERQSQLDHTDRDEALPILPTQYDPEEEVKEQMSFVMQELRLKVKPTPAVADTPPYARDVRMVTEYSSSIEEQELVPETFVPEDTNTSSERPPEQAEEEHSSGETSGPDSPQQTDVEDDSDAAVAEEEELARSRRSSSGSTLRQQHMQGSDSFSRDGSVSVGPSERSMSVQGDSEETATLREGSRSTSVGQSEEGDRRGSTATTASAGASKLRFGESDSFSSSKEEGSKWKLLKALKERKAEEKNIQEEKAAQAEKAKEVRTHHKGK